MPGDLPESHIWINSSLTLPLKSHIFILFNPDLNPRSVSSDVLLLLQKHNKTSTACTHDVGLEGNTVLLKIASGIQSEKPIEVVGMNSAFCWRKRCTRRSSNCTCIFHQENNAICPLWWNIYTQGALFWLNAWLHVAKMANESIVDMRSRSTTCWLS